MGVQFLRGPCWKGLDRTLTQTFIRHSVRSSRSLGSTFLSLGPLWPEKEEPLLSGAQARPGCGKSRTPEAPVWPPRPSVKCRPHLGDPNLPYLNTDNKIHKEIFLSLKDTYLKYTFFKYPVNDNTYTNSLSLSLSHPHTHKIIYMRIAKQDCLSLRGQKV